jgi:hypothetical protein
MIIAKRMHCDKVYKMAKVNRLDAEQPHDRSWLKVWLCFSSKDIKLRDLLIPPRSEVVLIEELCELSSN